MTVMNKMTVRELMAALLKHDLEDNILLISAKTEAEDEDPADGIVLGDDGTVHACHLTEVDDGLIISAHPIADE